jgi:hypothetical protein
MRIGRLARRPAHLRAARAALRVELHDAGFDDDPPGPEAAAKLLLPSTPIFRKAGYDFCAPAPAMTMRSMAEHTLQDPKKSRAKRSAKNLP